MDDEREAVDDLRTEVIESHGRLTLLVNGCAVHILGGYLICIDALGEMRLVTPPGR